MNEPSDEDQLPILQRLSSQQVIACLEDNTAAFVHLPLFNMEDENRPRYLKLDSRDYESLVSILHQDSDNCETHFYLDFDRDLVLDPNAEL